MTSQTNTGIWAFAGFIATFVAVEIFKKALKKGFKRVLKRNEQPLPALKDRLPEIQPETRFRLRKPRPKL
jgi:hypothetical protein